MISKLPKWVWFGGAVLAVIGGSINAVGFLGFQHQGVTHLTGTTTLLGIAAARGNIREELHLFAIIAAFVAGAIFSGALIKDSTLKLGRRYGIALLIESLLLFISIPLLHRSYPLGAYLTSCACGLQNGMVSTYSGAILRTTHVSGLFTDLGIFIGQLCRKVAVDQRKIFLCVVLIGSFFLGAVGGAIGFSYFSYDTLYFPATLTGCVGFSYTWYRHRLLVQFRASVVS